MNLSSTILGKNTLLTQLQNFSEEYILEVENTFKMGIENPEIKLETISELSIQQEIDSQTIKNTITLNQIKGRTESHIMQPFLEQSLALAEISKTLDLKRSPKGTLIGIIDKENLWHDWRQWKINRLKNVFPEEKEQIKFVKNYEKGIENFDEGLKDNLQYILMLPEIYEVVFPPNQQYNYLFSPKKFKSRLINEAVYQYQMKLVKLEEVKNELEVVLHAQLSNKDYIIEKYLNNIYKSTPDFTISDYSFSMIINYKLEKSTGKIIEANLVLVEKLHENLSYSIKMNLNKRTLFDN